MIMFCTIINVPLRVHPSFLMIMWSTKYSATSTPVIPNDNVIYLMFRCERTRGMAVDTRRKKRDLHYLSERDYASAHQSWLAVWTAVPFELPHICRRSYTCDEIRLRARLAKKTNSYPPNDKLPMPAERGLDHDSASLDSAKHQADKQPSVHPPTTHIGCFLGNR